MKTLASIQKDFHHSILKENSSVALRHIVSNHISAKDRFYIYRNTAIENLRNALEITYPNTWKLLGKTCADSVAQAFILQKNLPTTQCLDDWGHEFPSFLTEVRELKNLVYLKDISTIEWYKHRSYCAANARPLTARRLQKTLSGDLEKLQLIICPYVYLAPSNYSLKPIFELLDGQKDLSSIELKAEPSFALINRQNNLVNIEWLSYELFKMLFLIQQHKKTLSQAYSTILAEAPEFDLSTALQFMLEKELLWKYKEG